MTYSLNFGEWNKVFAIPNSVVDKYLSKLNEVQLKTLICLFRFGCENIDCQKISSIINVEIDKVTDALSFLCKCGIVKDLENKVNITEDFGIINDENNTEQKRTTIRYSHPSTGYVTERFETSKDIEYITKEAEVILGRPLSSVDGKVLVSLHDSYGLPADVIIMLLQYTMSVGKGNTLYIDKMGQSWAKNGVDTLGKAENKIKELERENINWKKFENIIGIYHREPTATEREAIMRWIDLWGYGNDMIKEAYERCVDKNGKYVLKYMDSIIKRWHTQGVVTLEQALLENKMHKEKARKSSALPKASYSIEEYENYDIMNYWDKLKKDK